MGGGFGGIFAGVAFKQSEAPGFSVSYVFGAWKQAGSYADSWPDRHLGDIRRLDGQRLLDRGDGFVL